MTPSKIATIDDLAAAVAREKAAGRKVVHCHGVFDLLHVGHIKHLEAAKGLGDVLVVTITPDRFVNKGPHRPAFPERLRAEALASLACVDYVAINEWPTAVETIRVLKPSFYVKGVVREAGKRDHTDAIDREKEAVEAEGGQLVLTDEETYSASTLINRYLDVFSPEVRAFLEAFRLSHAPEAIVDRLQALRSMRVLVVGETIIDEYQFCDVMGKSGKEPVLAARHRHTERYGGGALAVANHLAGFCDDVRYVSLLGAEASHEEFVRSCLAPGVRAQFVLKPGSPTIVKRRFLEAYLSAKLFEVYEMEEEDLDAATESDFLSVLEPAVATTDVVVVADYGHGLATPRVVDLLCSKSRFLAVNTQTNAGNRGFNMMSKYARADYFCIGEPEIRLEARNRKGDIQALVFDAARRLNCPRMIVTRGSQGLLCYTRGEELRRVPAFSIKVVDRIGAGDAVLAITSPCVAAGMPMEMAGFVGNVVGAEACMIMGHRQSIEPSSLYRHITSLLK